LQQADRALHWRKEKRQASTRNIKKQSQLDLAGLSECDGLSLKIVINKACSNSGLTVDGR
jgi:hypothetical protein